MNRLIRCSAIALALLADFSLAGAQVTGPDRNASGKNQIQSQGRKLSLTPAQKEMIFTAIRQSSVQVTPPPSNLNIAVGTQFPTSAQLNVLPDRAIADVPDVKPYKYTIVNDTLILVDPVSMQVVETIQ